MDAKIIFVIKYSCLITLCNSITSPQQNAFTEKPIPHLLNCCLWVTVIDQTIPAHAALCTLLHLHESNTACVIITLPKHNELLTFKAY